MKISTYLRYLAHDLFTACGVLTVAVAVYLAVASPQNAGAQVLWPIILIASAFTLFRYAFVNRHELGDRAQQYSFFICSLLADILVIILLFFFSPGRPHDMTLFFAYLIMLLLVKGMVYAMMRINGREEAKALNAKLLQYRNTRHE